MALQIASQIKLLNDTTSLGTISSSGLNVNHTDPDSRLTEEDGSYSRVTRGSNTTNRKNQILKPGGMGAVSFDGANGRVDLTSNPNWNMTGSLTLEAWVKPSNVNAGTYGIIYKSSNEHYALDRDSGTNYRFFCRFAGGWNTVTAVGYAAANTWAHVVGVYSNPASTCTIYINGVQRGQFSVSQGMSVQVDTSNLYVGSRNNSDRYWAGLIDEVRIYNTPLTSAQVVSSYNAGAGSYTSPASANLMGAYHFDEGTGTSAASWASSSVTGTLGGGASFVTNDGVVLSPSTTVEADIWKSQDGTGSLEAGIQTFGDQSGRLVLQGKTIRLFNGATEKARMDASGNVCIGLTAGTSPMHIGSSLSLSQRTLTASGTYTAASSDYQFFCYASNPSGTITITLPPASGVGCRVYALTKLNSNTAHTVGFGPTGNDLLDDTNAAKTISAQYTSLKMMSTGTSWYSVAT
jgi:hypothetical protein